MATDRMGVVTEQIEGDTLTPISIYSMITGRKKFLLESSYKHNETGRFSFIGADPIFELMNKNGKTILKRGESEEHLSLTFTTALEKLLSDIPAGKEFPFIGGAVGYIGYDFIRGFEEIGPIPEDSFDMPDAHLMYFNEIIAFDHINQKVTLIGIPQLGVSEQELAIKLEKRKQELSASGSQSKTEPFSLTGFVPSQTKDEFKESVETAKKMIEAGEVFQVVLSRRLTGMANGDPFTFYRKLRINNASPYMYFLDFDDYSIAGSSPESLIKHKGGEVVSNPIAGTRHRGRTSAEDEEMANDLMNDEKEVAEHKMLVDLSRNDLGRICEIGSVRVNKFMEVEKYQYVMHLVSEVSGTLASGAHPMDALAASLPAGTVSGAPKIRAMQIINQLEPQKRGVYSGAIGYFSACGSMDFALAIRTMVVKGSKGYLQAGAGIVFDSDPEKEYEETNHKLKSLLEAAK